MQVTVTVVANTTSGAASGSALLEFTVAPAAVASGTGALSVEPKQGASNQPFTLTAKGFVSRPSA